MRRGVGLCLLLAVGVAGLMVPVADALHDGVRSSAEVLEVVVPFVLVVVVLYMAYWTWGHVDDGGDVLLIAGWCVGIASGVVVIASGAILKQAINGVSLYQPFLLVSNVGVIGGVLGVIVGYFHVTARQRAREYAVARDRLAEQKHQLVFLNRLLRHDIRNDVNVIQGYADLLSDVYPDEPHLEPIRRKSKEIEELTVLAGDLSETATDTPTKEVRLAPMIEEAISHVRDSFPDATVSLEDEIPHALTVQANEMLAAVFQNLLRNAIQHNDKPIPTVAVRVDSMPDSVRVRITDNGPGIPETVKHALFQPGEKGPESTGTGLGLYLVESLVSNYDGDVWLSDAEDGGTTVTVEIPR